MKIWILGLIALILLLGSIVREGMTGSSTTEGAVEPKCPTGFTFKDGNCKSTSTTTVRPSCPPGFPVDGGDGKCFMTNAKIGASADKACPPETERSGETCVPIEPPPICPTGYMYQFSFADQTGKCLRIQTTSTPPPGSGGSAAVTRGNTTGGTSDTSYGPNSGARRKQVFGPISNGRGEGSDGVVPMDSSKTNQYPELLGGGDAKPSTRIDGVGIVPPTKNWQLANDGSLPSSESLKSSVPGDKDLIPDPYRVSQQFSAASYSFKTDPVPFLTDFSAFLK